MTDPEYFYESPVNRPSFWTYVRHLALLALTFCTATVAGTLFPFGPDAAPPDADPQTASELFNFVITIPVHYAGFLADAVHKIFTDAATLRYGLSFSISLLFILTCHEMGHYIACRIYKVDATLPFFIPTPPMIGPAGTFGAFIKILSPMPSRKAVFDIGVAGPIAGFIALIPVAVIGVLSLQPATAVQIASPSGLVFSDPLLLKLLGKTLGHDLTTSVGNPFYFASWVGLLVTALNLIPSGQLDGGHAIYAVFGETVHKWTGRIAFPIMATMAIVGFLFFNSPSGFLIAVILAVMMRIGHPRPYDQTPLDFRRKVIAFLTLVIFVLCFVPFPIQIN